MHRQRNEVARAVTPDQAVDEMMRSALYQLVVSEEAYSDKHGGYSTNLDTVFAVGKHTLPAGVTLTIVYASAHGWQAQAVHTRLPGKSCVMFFGFLDVFPLATTAQGLQLTEGAPGRPLCDK